jgi:hypothetical protein
MYGCLQHSVTACIYFMPPHGPLRLDLALMAGPCMHVALLLLPSCRCCCCCRPLMYGCLQHSVTACIYFMPPHGPSRLDLALMAGLSKHVALLPVVGKADAMTADEASECCRAVQKMLAEPAEYVPGIAGGGSINVYR